MVEACAEVCHTQRVEMLATSTLAAAQQAVDASVEWFEQAGTYGLLHPHLVRQSLRHIRDNDTMLQYRLSVRNIDDLFSFIGRCLVRYD